jgi:hypothetical protein
MYEALKICAPITLMTFAIFTRSEMVTDPGWPQVLATILVFIGTSGVAFALFGRFLGAVVADIPVRVVLAALSLVVLLHPDDTWALSAGAVVLVMTGWGVLRHNRLAEARQQALQLSPAQ